MLKYFMSNFYEQIISKAKLLNKKIILLESDVDNRISKAAKEIEDNSIAQVILLEKSEYFTDSKLKNELAQKLFELRQEKGLTLKKAQELINDPFYLGTMMVKENLADGLVGGSASPTPRFLKPALQILRIKNKYASGFFIMSNEQKTFIFADCAINPNPNAQNLADIALDSANSFLALVEKTPKIAMLSYSTKGSSTSESIEKIQQATTLVKQKNPNLLIDGEIQLDAALLPETAQLKCPQSPLKGDANILIFPDLNAGNIGYKLAKIFGNLSAFGPIVQGLQKPVNDLSRSSSIQDIVGVAAITAIQSSK
jgi:phosphate acetyltransferase